MLTAPNLEHLYDDHASALFAFLLNVLRDEADTKDVLQELFVKLARNPSLLAALRDRLKQKRTSAPLFDAEGFRRALEEVFIMMHKQA